MSTALTLPLMTAEQFFAAPEPVGDFTYEIHFGELVKVGRPKKRYRPDTTSVRRMLALRSMKDGTPRPIMGT